MTGACYLDTSAFVKLVAAESETRALRAFLDGRPEQVSSIILDTEAHRAAARFGPDVASRADRLLARITLVPLNLEVRALARTVPPLALRSLDAIHLATAVALGADLGVFLAYDRRLLDAATDAGLAVASPT
jgi:uncharacterized protein